MATRMILVRHGDPGYRNRFVGTTEYPLLDSGMESARKLGKRLGREGIKVLYSSGKKRAAKTADILAEAIGLKVSGRLEEFNELDFGKWEDKTFDEVDKEYPGGRKGLRDNLWNYSEHEGESYSMVRERVMPVVKELLRKHEGRCFAIVSHSIVMRVIWSALTGTDIREARSKEFSFLATLFFKKDGDKIELEKTWGVKNGL